MTCPDSRNIVKNIDAVEAEMTRVEPLKITVAPNGARRGKADHSELPLTSGELAATALECHLAGADEIHLHVRGEQGEHSLDTGLYREAIQEVETAVPRMTIQVTTEAAGVYGVEAQFSLLKELRPKSASIAVREIQRMPDLADRLYGFACEAGVCVQHILYASEDLVQLRTLLQDGTVPADMRDVLLVFGKYTPATEALPREVAPFVSELAGEFPNWTVCAFGRHENSVAEAAMKLGGHVRIGFENNIQRPDGTLARNNAENITRAVETARSLGRPLMSKELLK